MTPDEKFTNYRDASRRGWGTTSDGVSLEQIQIGAILRIADAMENIDKDLMAINTRLLETNNSIRKRQAGQKRAADLEKRIDRALGRCAYLRGELTKLKRGKV